ncbi:MAG: hypothetical protein DBW77_02780 [Cryomorphaceae bacterium]|nr:MAG: hypothetical protein DBW77_02780 [Cryomorphaceae bacterium]
MKQKTQSLSLIPIVVISIFYISYLLKWEPVLLGVFRELLLLPSVLIQISFTVYFIIKVLKKEIKFNLLAIINFIFSLLLILSFIV